MIVSFCHIQNIFFRIVKNYEIIKNNQYININIIVIEYIKGGYKQHINEFIMIITLTMTLVDIIYRDVPKW